MNHMTTKNFNADIFKSQITVTHMNHICPFWAPQQDSYMSPGCPAGRLGPAGGPGGVLSVADIPREVRGSCEGKVETGMGCGLCLALSGRGSQGGPVCRRSRCAGAGWEGGGG